MMNVQYNFYIQQGEACTDCPREAIVRAGSDASQGKQNITFIFVLQNFPFPEKAEVYMNVLDDFDPDGLNSSSRRLDSSSPSRQQQQQQQSPSVRKSLSFRSVASDETGGTASTVQSRQVTPMAR